MRDLFFVILFYLVIFTVYFAPQLRGELLLSGDSFTQNYPLRLYMSTLSLKNFLWLPHEFLGLPFLGILHPGLLYPLNFLYLFLPASFVFGFNIVFHYALAAFFTFLCLHQLELDRFPAFLGGLIFGCSGFLMAHKGHISMINAAVWLPLLLFLYERIRFYLTWKYSAWAAVVVAVQVLAGHYQISVYTYLVLGFFTLFYSKGIIKDKRLKFILLCVTPIVWGSLIALPQLVASKELSDIGLRLGYDYDFITEYSFHPFMLPTFIFPFIFGMGYGGPYWGPWNLGEMAGFVGILPLALGTWTVVRFGGKNLHIRFLGWLAAFAFLLALGRYNPLYRIMYYIPIYSFFRVPARHWLEFDLAIAMLSAFGLQHLLSNVDLKKNCKELLIVFSMLGILCLAFLGLGKFLYVNYCPSSFHQHAQWVLAYVFSVRNPAVFIPLGFLCFYLAWLYLLQRTGTQSYWPKKLFLYLAIGSILAESFSFGGFYDTFYVKPSDVRNQLKDPLRSFLKDRAGYERTVFFTNNENFCLFTVPAGIFTLNGYDPLIPKGFHELLGMSPRGFSDDWAGLLQNNLILSTLNVKYIAVLQRETQEYKFTENKVAFDLAQSELAKSPNIPLGEWDRINSTQAGKEGFILTSPDEQAVSMVSQKLSLRPATTYLLSLEAHSNKGKNTRGLFLDLCGEDYDSAEQELYVGPQELTQEYRTFFRKINTGKNIPMWVELRAFTFSREPIMIRNVKLMEINNSRVPSIANLNRNASEEGPVYRNVFHGSDWVVYENLNCLPRAFTVSKIDIASDIKEVKKKFELFEFNPADTALVHHEDLTKIGRTNFAKGVANIEKYDTDCIIIKTEFKSGPGFLILSDQYFPGWIALVDGQKTPIFQTNGLLRGIVVPEGSHTVEFKYSPWRIYFAAIIGFFSLAAALFVALRSQDRFS